MVVRKVVGDGRESHAVEARDPGPRGDPEIAVSRLDHAGEGVVRQAFFNAPALDDIAERRVGPRVGSRDNKQAEQQPAGSYDGAVRPCGGSGGGQTTSLTFTATYTSEGSTRTRSSVAAASIGPPRENNERRFLTCTCNYAGSSFAIEWLGIPGNLLAGNVHALVCMRVGIRR